MKNKILSVFCAIAMLATMMSAFVMSSSAADAPAITMTVLKQATAAGEEAEVQIGYEGLEEGSSITGIQVTMPLDTTKFTFVDGSQKDVMAGGEIAYGSRTQSVKFSFAATSASQYVKATEGVLGTFSLKLAEGVEAGTTYELVADEATTKIMLETGTINLTGKAALSTGEVQKPAIPEEPEMPAEAYVYAKVLEQPENVGDEVTIELSYANLPADASITGMQVVMPLDTAVLTFVDGSQADVMAGGEIAYGSRTQSVKFSFAATSASQYVKATEGVLGTFKVKLADTVAYGTSVELSIDEATTKFMLESGTVMMKGVASTIVVGAGGEEEPEVTPTPTPDVTPTPTPDVEEVPAFETEVVPAEKTIAGGKVTVFTATVAPAAGTTAEAVTALLVDDEYQVIFDGKTSKGYAAGWAIATVSKADLIDAITSGTPVVNAEISIGGADVVTVSVLDSEGNTVVLAAE